MKHSWNVCMDFLSRNLSHRLFHYPQNSHLICARVNFVRMSRKEEGIGCLKIDAHLHVWAGQGEESKFPFQVRKDA